MKQLREFLRHQYIGAIVIGLLAYQGLSAFLSAVVTPLIVLMGNYGRSTSVLGSEQPAMDLLQLVPNIARGVVTLALAYLLLRWLYSAPKAEPLAEPETVEE
ncbi:MAG TPA: hypothetical protein VN577_19890 [Terriglobales bacterium]|nr:hypothetical protein [Terriglobales bacterium]